MTTSAYMPDVQVEIAWNAGYGTPAASRVWTDVSSYVEQAHDIVIEHGRGDEFAVADPNKMSLVLDNRDGRFTADKVDGAYYPNVKIGRPIRVTATPVGGDASVRFVGYVDVWPVEWLGTHNYATAKITASSRMARLGFDLELGTIIEETYMLGAPATYYSLNDPEGSTAATPTTPSSPLLQVTGVGAAVTFGVASGPGTDGSHAAEFAGGKFLAYSTGAGDAVSSVEAFFSTTDTGGDIAALSGNNGNFYNLTLGLDGAGHLIATAGLNGGTIVTATSAALVNTGALRHGAAFLVQTAALEFRVDLYLNGVLVDSSAASSFFVGGDIGARLRVGQNFVGTLSHVAAGGSDSNVESRATSGLTGFANDSASTRISRYALLAGIPAAEYVGDSDTNPVGAIDTAGRTTIDNMRVVEQTENGILFDGRDNTLVFHGRARRYNDTSAFTLNLAKHEVESGISPKLDRSSLVNDVTGTASDGTTARAINYASVEDYGYSRATVEVAASNAVALQAAAWQVNTYGIPKPRIPSLGVDLLPLTLAGQTTLLGLDVSSRITLINLPGQAPASTLDFFIEGYTETIGAVAHLFDFNVSPVTGFDVFVLDDAVLGVLDDPQPLAF